MKPKELKRIEKEPQIDPRNQKTKRNPKEPKEIPRNPKEPKGTPRNQTQKEICQEDF